jgi:hypothetical protein
VALKDARGADASIPHLQSDHLPVFLYQTVVPVAGADVKLVLPESEDLVVDMYAALGRPDDDPHWATLWQGSVALAEEVLSNPACWTSARASGSRASPRGSPAPRRWC